MRRDRAVAVGAGVLALIGVLALVLVVTRDDPPEAARPGATSSSPTSSSPAGTVAPTTEPAAVSPFTGRPVKENRPVLAVKIDNVRPARPQTGLDRADIVYVEPVEGGLSRIMAIFSGRRPSRVGPVRSARESDLELLAQYGRPGLVYSGANATVRAAIRKAPIADLSQDQVPSAYSRSSSQAAPHNLMADPQRLIDRGRDIGTAEDIGFRFGAAPADGGTTTKRRTVRYPAATTAFSWSGARKRWDVTLDGQAARTTSGVRLGASTVVVQYTKITSSKLHDVLGNPTPYTHTVGSGRAVVLRDGKAFKARWSRSSEDSGTTFTTSAGDDLPFAAGPVWVVFAEE